MEIKKIKISQTDIAEILQDIKRGILRIPRFQRDFVWPKSKTVKLLHSIYKEFPIGSIFIWDAPKSYNMFYRDVPDLKISAPDEGDQIRFILDGQQRLTSLYVAINGLTVNGINYDEICFDLDTEKFLSRPGDLIRFIPLSYILSKEKESERLKIYESLTLERKPKFSKCSERFTNYPISMIIVKDKNLEEVCNIFERINQGGQRLSIFDLVVASTYDPDFELKEKIGEFIEEFSESFGELDPEVVAETLSLILKGQCTRVAQLQLAVEEIKKTWLGTCEAIRKAIDFVRENLGVRKYDFLPYRDMIPMLAYFYYKSPKMSGAQKEKIIEWFWKATFSERYGANTFTRMGEDRALFDRVLLGESVKFNYPITVTSEKLKNMSMTRRGALRKAIFCILAMQNPMDLRNNNKVSLDRDYFSEFNKAEKHHIFPKSKFKQFNMKEREGNTVLNFCFIPADLNKEIMNKRPSEYFAKYKVENESFEKAAKSHLIPVEGDLGIWKDDYRTFLDQRAKLIETEIKKLVGETTKIESELQSDPNKTLDELEQKLRYKIHEVLYDEFGDMYWDQAVPPDVNQCVLDRIGEHLKKQPYLDKKEFEKPNRRLEFNDIMDYLKIILKNWPLFEDTFGSKDQLEKHFKNLKDYRNSVRHAREMTNVQKKEGEASVEWLWQILFERGDVSDEEQDEEESTDAHMDAPTRELYLRFEEEILKLGTDIQKNPRKHYIAFKRSQNFVSLKLQHNQIKLFLRLPEGKFEDPQNRLRNVTEVGRHGTGDYELLANSILDLEYSVQLIRQAYNADQPKQEISLDDHLKKIKDPAVADKFLKLLEFIKSSDEELIQEQMKSYVDFSKKEKTYCWLITYGKVISLRLYIPETHESLAGLTVEDARRPGWVYVNIDNQTNLEKVKKAIKIAFERLDKNL